MAESIIQSEWGQSFGGIVGSASSTDFVEQQQPTSSPPLLEQVASDIAQLRETVDQKLNDMVLQSTTDMKYLQHTFLDEKDKNSSDSRTSSKPRPRDPGALREQADRKREQRGGVNGAATAAGAASLTTSLQVQTETNNQQKKQTSPSILGSFEKLWNTLANPELSSDERRRHHRRAVRRTAIADHLDSDTDDEDYGFSSSADEEGLQITATTTTGAATAGSRQQDQSSQSSSSSSEQTPRRHHRQQPMMPTSFGAAAAAAARQRQQQQQKRRLQSVTAATAKPSVSRSPGALRDLASPKVQQQPSNQAIATPVTALTSTPITTKSTINLPRQHQPQQTANAATNNQPNTSGNNKQVVLEHVPSSLVMSVHRKHSQQSNHQTAGAACATTKKTTTTTHSSSSPDITEPTANLTSQKMKLQRDKYNPEMVLSSDQSSHGAASARWIQSVPEASTGAEEDSKETENERLRTIDTLAATSLSPTPSGHQDIVIVSMQSSSSTSERRRSQATTTGSAPLQQQQQQQLTPHDEIEASKTHRDFVTPPPAVSTSPAAMPLQQQDEIMTPREEIEVIDITKDEAVALEPETMSLPQQPLMQRHQQAPNYTTATSPATTSSTTKQKNPPVHHNRHRDTSSEKKFQGPEPSRQKSQPAPESPPASVSRRPQTPTRTLTGNKSIDSDYHFRNSAILDKPTKPKASAVRQVSSTVQGEQQQSRQQKQHEHQRMVQQQLQEQKRLQQHHQEQMLQLQKERELQQQEQQQREREREQKLQQEKRTRESPRAPEDEEHSRTTGHHQLAAWRERKARAATAAHYTLEHYDEEDSGVVVDPPIQHTSHVSIESMISDLRSTMTDEGSTPRSFPSQKKQQEPRRKQGASPRQKKQQQRQQKVIRRKFFPEDEEEIRASRNGAADDDTDPDHSIAKTKSYVSWADEVDGYTPRAIQPVVSGLSTPAMSAGRRSPYPNQAYRDRTTDVMPALVEDADHRRRGGGVADLLPTLAEDNSQRHVTISELAARAKKTASELQARNIAVGNESQVNASILDKAWDRMHHPNVRDAPSVHTATARPDAPTDPSSRKTAISSLTSHSHSASYETSFASSSHSRSEREGAVHTLSPVNEGDDLRSPSSSFVTLSLVTSEDTSVPTIPEVVATSPQAGAKHKPVVPSTPFGTFESVSTQSHSGSSKTGSSMDRTDEERRKGREPDHHSDSNPSDEEKKEEETTVNTEKEANEEGNVVEEESIVSPTETRSTEEEEKTDGLGHVSEETVRVRPIIVPGQDVSKTVQQNPLVVRLEQVVDKTIQDPYGDYGVYTGVLLRGRPQGQGSMVYADGRKYIGEWKAGCWDGHGRTTYCNGDNFSGQYKMDKRHGVGRYEWVDGRIYDGEFVNDHREGYGTFSFPDGSVYSGHFKAGQRHGQGCYKFANAAIYNGEFKEGQYHGVGECIWADGRCYLGEWFEGRAHGYGVEIRADGTIRHDGEWRKDRPVRPKSHASGQLPAAAPSPWRNTPKSSSSSSTPAKSALKKRKTVQSRSTGSASVASSEYLDRGYIPLRSPGSRLSVDPPSSAQSSSELSDEKMHEASKRSRFSMGSLGIRRRAMRENPSPEIPLLLSIRPSSPSHRSAKTAESHQPDPPARRPKYVVGGEPKWAKRIRAKKQAAHQITGTTRHERTLIRD